MNSFSIGLFCVICGLLSPTAFAYEPEEGKVSLTLGSFMFITNFQADHDGINPERQHAPALIAEGSVNHKGSLEIGVFPMHKLYIREQQNSFTAEELKVIYITMGYRQWFSKRLSGALAFFSSYPMGDPSVVHNDSAPAGILDTSARDATEYGFDFSVMLEVFTHKKWAITLDSRYSLSVTNKDNEESDHYGAMVGIRYQVQEKYEKKSPEKK